jgi:hypothetical protein
VFGPTLTALQYGDRTPVVHCHIALPVVKYVPAQRIDATVFCRHLAERPPNGRLVAHSLPCLLLPASPSRGFDV